MNIFLFKNGEIFMAEEDKPIEGVSLKDLAMCITHAGEGQALMFNGAMWINAPATLYVNEVVGDAATTLDKTYADISGAVGAGRTVVIKSAGESGGTVLTAVGSFGGSDEAGYTVTAGSNTYTADASDGVLTKQVEGAE